MEVIEEVDGLPQYVIPFDDADLAKSADNHRNNNFHWDVLW